MFHQLFALTMILTVAAPAAAQPVPFQVHQSPAQASRGFHVEPFLEDIRGIPDFADRQRRILEGLPVFLGKRETPVHGTHERNVANLDDIQELLILFLIPDRTNRDMDYVDFSELSRPMHHKIRRYIEDEPVGQALRMLGHFYLHKFRDASIKARLAPFAAAVVDLSIGSRYVFMNGDDFPVPELLKRIDASTDNETRYSARIMEFRVLPQEGAEPRPLVIQARLKPTFLQTCKALLLNL